MVVQPVVEPMDRFAALIPADIPDSGGPRRADAARQRREYQLRTWRELHKHGQRQAALKFTDTLKHYSLFFHQDVCINWPAKYCRG